MSDFKILLPSDAHAYFHFYLWKVILRRKPHSGLVSFYAYPVFLAA